MGVKIAITIGVILYILGAVGGSFCLWDWLSRGEPSVSSTIRNLVLSWGAPLATGLAVWRSIVAQKQVEAAQKTATAQLEANQATGRGQRQERMKNAIGHLGNASDPVRLGGAYELFHLAEDTEDLGQRQTVLDILCAHIRWTTLERKYRGHSGGPEYIEYRDKYPSKPSEEIQSLLTLLFVQKREVFTGLDINLQGSCLNGSNLNKARLEKAHLRGAQLHGADLTRAQLHGASSNDLKPPYEPFETVINGRICKDSDLTGAISAGGLAKEAIDCIGKGLPDEEANELREKLKAHIGDARSREFDLPKNSGATRGKYTAEDAAQWIAEYKTALCLPVPVASDNALLCPAWATAGRRISAAARSLPSRSRHNNWKGAREMV